MSAKPHWFRWLLATAVIAAIGIIIGCGVWIHEHEVRPIRHSTMCKTHLRQLSLALDSYHERYQRFPPACTLGSDGRPWHSWRVLILPELGEQKLFDAYRFDEPWDGPLKRVTSPNPLHTRFTLDQEEELLIPKLSFNIAKSFDELLNAEIVDSSFSKGGNPELIIGAKQATAFVLDERGAKLESTAEIATFVTEFEEEPPPPPKVRKFHFDRPFLVLLREKQSHDPYFAVWLANTELMKPMNE